MSSARQQQGGLSIQTLVIASAASMAAAIVVHEVWKGGAILGAAITPVVVAIVSESLRRPVDKVTAIRGERRTRTPVGVGASEPPTREVERPDPFGIWQDDVRAPRSRRVEPKHLKIALATGLGAFAIGAFALTGAELVFGGNVGGGGSDTTIFRGGGSSSDKKTSTTETTETSTTETTPTEATETVPPEGEVPTDTAPVPEGSTPPPAEAPPATVPPATVPAEPPPATTPPPGQEVTPSPTP